MCFRDGDEGLVGVLDGRVSDQDALYCTLLDVSRLLGPKPEALNLKP